jgi:nucleotide-binding universal stress UspA family protein
MNTVILATDGSTTAEAATATAIAEAKTRGATLVVVTVWDVLYSQFGFPVGAVLPDLDHVEQGQAEKVASAAAEQARAAGLDTRIATRRGNTVEQICAVAEERNAELIVLGTHGWGALQRMVFGSVSTGVVHHAPCPVLVVPPAAEAASAELSDSREPLLVSG